MGQLKAAEALGNGARKSASLMAQLTMPLYEAGTIYSQTRQAIEKVGQARGLTDDAQRAAVQGAIQAWETIQASRASIASFEAAVRSDAVALEGLRREQLAGTRTITDVLERIPRRKNREGIPKDPEL